MTEREKHDRMANAIRFLSMDAVEKANSGHPGLPMGAADIATVLFTRFLKYDADRSALAGPRPLHPVGRPRLDAALFAALSHRLSRTSTIDEIKHFRQLGSRTAGHPEYGHAAGIETTTGPLGQGLANSVGFALGERIMNAAFGNDLVDHHTYVLAGDGCLMEGISPGGDHARRPPQAQQADRDLGQQPHLDRRRRVAGGFDRPGGALRRRRLGHDAYRRP